MLRFLETNILSTPKQIIWPSPTILARSSKTSVILTPFLRKKLDKITANSFTDARQTMNYSHSPTAISMLTFPTCHSWLLTILRTRSRKRSECCNQVLKHVLLFGANVKTASSSTSWTLSWRKTFLRKIAPSSLPKDPISTFMMTRVFNWRLILRRQDSRASKSGSSPSIFSSDQEKNILKSSRMGQSRTTPRCGALTTKRSSKWKFRPAKCTMISQVKILRISKHFRLPWSWHSKNENHQILIPL